MNLQFEKHSGKPRALIFGAAYGFVIGLTPLGAMYGEEYCLDLGGDEFLFGGKQLVFSICAALAFYILTFLTLNGWKGLFKTIAVSYLCLYLYAVFHIYQLIRHDPCFFPYKSSVAVTGEILAKVLIISSVITAFSTIFLVPALLVCLRIPVRLLIENDDFLKLDINAK